MTMALDTGTAATARTGRRARTSLVVVVALIAIAAAAAMPWALPEHILTAAIVILLNAYLAQCWNLAAGYAGQFSLGHPVFFGVGAYASSVLLTRYGISPWLGGLVGAALAALVGALLSALAFRFKVRGVFFAVVTLSAAEVARSLFENWDFVGGTSGVMLTLRQSPADMMFLSRTPYYELILAMVVALALATKALAGSRFGQQLLALREDEPAAEAIGVSTFRCKVAIIAVSAGVTALAGTFYAQLLLFIVPNDVFSFEHMMSMMLGTMVGGAGTVLGPLLGSSLFGVLSEALRNLPFTNSREAASAVKILYAFVLILVVLRLPGGLLSLVARRRSR